MHIFRNILQLPKKILSLLFWWKKFHGRQRLAAQFLTVLVLLGVNLAGYFLFFELNKAQAAWWNEEWGYRQAATVTNSNGAELTDFQVMLSVDTAALITAGKMKSDCSDIRITNYGGEVLPHWVETGGGTCNTSATNIWVKVDAIPTGGGILLLYYGNSSATNTSDGNEVFTFFDDFNTNNGDWTVVDGTFAITGGVADFNGGSCDFFYNTERYVEAASIIESRVRVIGATTGAYHGFIWPMTSATLSSGDCGTSSGDWYLYAGFSDDETNARILEKETTNYSIRATGANASTFGQWYKWTMKNDGLGDLTFNVDGSTVTSYTDASPRPNGPGYIGWREGDIEIDWVASRKYASTDPTVTFGSEEKSPGPVAYWKFDEGQGTTAKDSTSNRLDGTIDGASWKSDSECLSGKCLSFDGSNDYVDMGTDSKLSPENITISAWVYSTDSSGSNYVVVKADDTDKDYSMLVSDGTPSFTIFSGSTGYTATSTTTVDTNRWYHLTGSWDGTTIKIYVDSVLTGSTTPGVTRSVTSQRLTIGARPDFGGGWFNGKIDEVKIYPYILSTSQMQANYNTGASVLGAKDNSPLSNGLIGHWKMDETTWNGTPDEVVDSSGNGNHGTAISGTEASPSAKFGRAAYLAGTDEHIDLGTDIDVSSGNLTISAWVYLRAYQSWTSIFEKGVASECVSLSFSNTNGQNLQYTWNNTNFRASNVITSNSTIPLNTWTHVAVTSNGSTATIYINGEPDITAAAGLPCSDSDTSYIGVNFPGGDEYMRGSVDEVRLYNRALTTSELKQLYNYAPPPVAYYKFDEASGGTYYDSAGGDNNAGNQGSVTRVDGKYDRGVRITAGSGWVRSSANVPTPKVLSVSEWIKPTVGGGDIFGMGNGALNFGLNANGSLWFRMRQADGSYPSSPSTSAGVVPMNTWSHVAVTYDGATVRFYVNGNNVTSTAYSINPYPYGTDQQIMMGYASVNYFDGGSIDEVKYYDYARTSGQIMEDMNHGRPVSSHPLVQLKFDEGSGTAAKNSGNGGSVLNGTITGATWADGKIGKSLSFSNSGTIQNVQVTGSGIMENVTDTSYSWGAWFKPRSTPAGTTSSSLYTIVGRPGWHSWIGYGSDNRITLSIANTNPVRFDVGSTETYALNEWHYVMGVIDDTQKVVSLYVNGKLVDSSSYWGTLYNYGTSSYTIGSSNTSGSCSDNYAFCMDGYIDEVKIYNTALTDTEVKANFNSGKALVLGSTGTESDGKTPSNSSDRRYCPPGDTTATCGPIAEWNFEERQGASTADTSGNGNTGTLTGGPSWTTGKIGSALSFDGSDDYIGMGSISSASSLSLSGTPFAISLWIKPTTTGDSYQRLIDKSSNTFATDGYALSLSDNRTAIDFYSDGGAVFIDWGSLTADAWHHIVLVHTGSGSYTLYINGVAVNSITGQETPPATTSNMRIGTWNHSDAREYNGQMDQVQIFDYALSPSQIAWNYNRGAPVAHFKLNECQGSVANDSINRLTGTISIGAGGTQTSAGTCQTGSTAWGNGATGKFGSSLNFDGTDDFISIPDNNALDLTEDMTMEAWVYAEDDDNYNAIISKDYTAEFEMAADFRNGDAILATRWTSGQRNFDNFFNGYTNQWVHVAVTVSNSTISAYRNGVLFGTDTAPARSASTNPVTIGRRSSSGQYFNGKIDEVKLYNYALSINQIKTSMNQSSAIRYGPSTGNP